MLYKIPLMLINAVTFHRSNTPPAFASAPQAKRTAVNPNSFLGLYERVVVNSSYLTRTGYWVPIICETAAILAAQYPTSEFSRRILTFLNAKGTLSYSGGQITNIFLIGSAILITGASIRFRCFKTMGDRFTFSMALRDSHKLCTAGPYSIVRHPGYTGGLMHTFGAFLTLMCSGSWWYGGGYSTLVGMALSVNFLAMGVFAIVSFTRGKKEDEFLKREFGTQWDDWAKNVPYQYIPGII